MTSGPGNDDDDEDDDDDDDDARLPCHTQRLQRVPRWGADTHW